MSGEFYAREDIYGKNGVLLLGKGQRMTREVIARLKRLGLFKPDICELKERNEEDVNYAPEFSPGYDFGDDPGLSSGYDSDGDPENAPGYDSGYDSGYAYGYDPGYHPGNYREYNPERDNDTRHEQNYIHSQNAEASRIINALGIKMNIHNDRVLEHPNKVLNTIIFYSKTKPWWIYVNALSNYVSWIYTHSIDVAIISLIIAKELGYSDKELWNIGLGAFMHDVGKLLIPKDILQKPRELDTREMAYIRQHCELGMISLEPYCLAKECTDIVMQHHERLDGSGYPHGLKGNEICRNARIVMIADAFDAITSGRPYKQPKDADAAIRMLKDEGIKYSQGLVSLLEEILE